MLRKVLLGAVALVALTAAPAAAQYNPTVVQPGSVQAGGVITVTGESCTPNSDITITIEPLASASSGKSTRAVGTDPDPGPQGTGEAIVTVHVHTDAQGKFSVQITIPAGTAPGQYVVNSDDDCVKGAIITVLPANANNGGGNGTGGGSLSRTGSDIDKMGMAGAGLLVLGGLILVATKRRRHEGAAPAV